MNEQKIIVGLDIGTTKVCAIVGRSNEFGKIDILGMGKVSSNGGVNRGVVSNIDLTVDAIQKAVQIASDKSSVNINRVHVGIAGAHINSLQHRGMIIRGNGEDEITAEDLNKLEQDMYKIAVRPGDKIIHVLPQDWVIDDEPINNRPIGMAGTKVEGNFHIITGQVTAARNIHKCVEKAGIQVADLILEPLASSYAVLSDEEMEAGVVLVDIGGGTTDVAIFHDNIIRHTAVIPYGGNIITEDIKEGCHVMRNQAELLKTKFGSALADASSDNEIVSIPGITGREPKEISVKNLARIIQSRMEEIFDLVYYEIKASNLEKKLAGGIVLTGGGAMLKHIGQLAEYSTGLDARIGFPNEHLAKGMVEEVKSPVYATAVGLVLRGLINNESEPAKSNTAIKPSTPREKGEGLFSKIITWLKDETKDVDDFN